MLFTILIAVLISTAIGYNIKTDRWVDVPLKDLNLSVVPSRNRGMGAACRSTFRRLPERRDDAITVSTDRQLRWQDAKGGETVDVRINQKQKTR